MKNTINIVLFAYNFPHRKTIDFINMLSNNGFVLSLILAADYIKIKKPKSVFLFKEKPLKTNTEKLAHRYKIPFYVVKHNSKETLSLLKKYKINCPL